MTIAVESVQERLSKRFAKWDTNGNGVLEPSDFIAEADRIAGAFGKPGEADELKEAFLGLFQGLTAAAPGPLTSARFTEAANAILERGEGAFEDLLRPVARAIVRLADHDGNGVIDAGEFATWLRAVGSGKSEAEALEDFQEIAKGKSVLTEDELLAAIRDFHFGRLDVELLG